MPPSIVVARSLSRRLSQTWKEEEENSPDENPVGNATGSGQPSVLSSRPESATTMWQDGLAGAIAGGVSRVLTAPFDIAKIRYQFDNGKAPRYTDLLSTMQSIKAEEGWVTLWRGNAAAMCLWVSYATVQFAVYGHVNEVVDGLDHLFSRPQLRGSGDNSEPPGTYQLKRFLAGSMAGGVATVATYPFDITRTAMAFQGVPKQYPNSWAFVQHTYRTAGVTGFFRGLSPALAQIVPQVGLSFTVYESIKRHPPEHPLLKASWPSVAGGVAGLISKVALYPFDTVKKRVQAQVLRARDVKYGVLPKYTNAVHAVRTIVAEEGPRALFRGIVPAMWKSSVATGITFTVFEWSRDALQTVT